MTRATHLNIEPGLCQSCARCDASKACRMKAIVQVDPGEQPYLDTERCRDCWICIPACPYGAVRKTQPGGLRL